MRSSRSPLKSISLTSTMSLSTLSNEILSNIDSELCLIALEYILTLLASQSLLALKSENLSNREKQLIRREISNEVSLFHDFIRKKIFINFKDHKSIWQRKKHGLVMMMDIEENEKEDNNDEDGKKLDEQQHKQELSSDSSKISKKPLKISTSSTSMRVNVVRRLHLEKQQQQQQSNTEEQNISMNVSSRKPISSSTPFVTKPSTSRKGLTQNNNGDNDDIMEEDEFNYFLDNEEHSYSPFSYVQLVEEDYLHFLSNLFHVICLND